CDRPRPTCFPTRRSSDLVIPEGYGAGIVMLWDQGTWTPQVDDVDAALKQGDLKFTLDGFKLKGSWVLVRTRAWGKNAKDDGRNRSEEHTSELQSLAYLVC